MSFEEINQILTEAPAKKARYFELYEMAKLEEDRIKGQVYLEKKVSNQATVKAIEAFVDTDQRVIDAETDRIIKERDFYQAKDELESYIEIARNLRAEVKNIEPFIPKDI